MSETKTTSWWAEPALQASREAFYAAAAVHAFSPDDKDRAVYPYMGEEADAGARSRARANRLEFGARAR